MVMCGYDDGEMVGYGIKEQKNWIKIIKIKQNGGFVAMNGIE